MSARRGNESPAHLRGKREAARVLKELGLIVSVEHHEADVAALVPGSGLVFCVEVESSRRNVVRNLERNAARGAAFTIILAVNRPSLDEIRRLDGIPAGTVFASSPAELPDILRARVRL